MQLDELAIGGRLNGGVGSCVGAQGTRHPTPMPPLVCHYWGPAPRVTPGEWLHISQQWLVTTKLSRRCF